VESCRTLSTLLVTISRPSISRCWSAFSIVIIAEGIVVGAGLNLLAAEDEVIENSGSTELLC
jgi:hypothetical protein